MKNTNSANAGRPPHSTPWGAREVPPLEVLGMSNYIGTISIILSYPENYMALTRDFMISPSVASSTP